MLACATCLAATQCDARWTDNKPSAACCLVACVFRRGGNWRGAAGSASQSGGVFGESPPSNHVGWLMGATPPEMNGLYGTSPLYGGSGGSSGKRGGYLSSSPRGGAAHPSECVGQPWLRCCALG